MFCRIKNETQQPTPANLARYVVSAGRHYFLLHVSVLTIPVLRTRSQKQLQNPFSVRLMLTRFFY